MRARTDAERFAWLLAQVEHSKWSDVFEWLRPMDSEGNYTEKYINSKTFRDVVDAKMESSDAS